MVIKNTIAELEIRTSEYLFVQIFILNKVVSIFSTKFAQKKVIQGHNLRKQVWNSKISSLEYPHFIGFKFTQYIFKLCRSQWVIVGHCGSKCVVARFSIGQELMLFSKMCDFLGFLSILHLPQITQQIFFILFFLVIEYVLILFYHFFHIFRRK